MRNLVLVALPIAAVLTAGLVAADKPKTPLGRWMQPNVVVPLEGEDYDTLKTSLALVAAKPPPVKDYPNWVAIAKAGAEAAAKGNLAAVKKCCPDCHDIYRKKYIAEQAARSFP